MRPTGRLILGGATLVACGLVFAAAGATSLRAIPLLSTGCLVAATSLAFAYCISTSRRDRKLHDELSRRLAESSETVRELRLQLNLVRVEEQNAQTILDDISDAVPVIEPADVPAEAEEPDADVNTSRYHKAGESSQGSVALRRNVPDEKALSEVKNEFVSMVSHELRTPLACIKAYVEMLIDGEAEDPATQHEFYDVIQNEANRLGRLIDNILNISRIEAGLVSSNKQPHDLAKILNDAIEVIRPQTREKNITLTTNVMCSDYRTPVDRDMLFQAVLNLLSNAVKYTPDGRSISIEAGVDPDRKRVFTKIIDTGVGIPPKDLPYVFDKFYRAEANNRIAPGTGLGLALVRHIIETVHNGRMFAQSCVGKGSCFGFELDLC